MPYFDRVGGIDFSLNMLALARSSLALPIQGEADRLPIATGSVDFLISFGLTEHLYEIAGFFSEVRRVLNGEGRATIRFLNRRSVWRHATGRQYPGGLQAYSARDVGDASLASGLHLLHVRPFQAAGPLTSYLPPLIDRLERIPGLNQFFLATFKPVGS
ncbi:MAG: class I SAM-dependent methyltransferase [Acidobacteriota bacterium]|nr:class I SAM-dependent methyltransferase [Acidobacteriota bacterium]